MAGSFMSYDERDDQREEEIKREPEVEVVSSEGQTIEIDEQMRQALGGGKGGIEISAPEYTTLKKGNMQVSFAVINEEDYYYQVELLEKSPYGDKEVLGILLQALSSVVPNHIHTYVREPSPDIDWDVFTIIVKKGATLIGAKKFMEDKLVNKLLSLQLWG